MANDSYIYNYLNQLNHAIHSLHLRLEAAEQRVSQLENTVETLKKEPKMNVERIEYKFDQLKIERLDGTLNIGLTPKSGQGLFDDLSLGEESHMRNVQSPETAPPFMHDILNQVDIFLKNEAMDALIKIENQQAFPLNEPYRLFIIEDIRKQIPHQVTRIAQGMGQNPEQKRLLEEDPEQASNIVLEVVKQDVLQALERFVINLKNGGASQ